MSRCARLCGVVGCAGRWIGGVAGCRVRGVGGEEACCLTVLSAVAAASAFPGAALGASGTVKLYASGFAGVATRAAEQGVSLSSGAAVVATARGRWPHSASRAAPAAAHAARRSVGSDGIGVAVACELQRHLESRQRGDELQPGIRAARSGALRRKRVRHGHGQLRIYHL